MNKIAAVKLVARVIVGSGTTTITNSIIKNNVATDSLPTRISVAVASVVIGSMAAEATKSHTDQKIDEVVELWSKTKSTDEDTTVTV